MDLDLGPLNWSKYAYISNGNIRRDERRVID
jgi:hypothetical protein